MLEHLGKECLISEPTNVGKRNQFVGWFFRSTIKGLPQSTAHFPAEFFNINTDVEISTIDEEKSKLVKNMFIPPNIKDFSGVNIHVIDGTMVKMNNYYFPVEIITKTIVSGEEYLAILNKQEERILF